MTTSKALSALSAAYRTLTNVFVVLAGVIVAFATLSVAAGIATSYFFDYPLPWVTEVTEFGLLYLPYLLGVWVLQKDGHVRMDIVLKMLPTRAQHTINTITAVVCALICLILCWFGTKVTLDLYRSKAFTYTILEAPKWILTIVIAVGSLMLVIEFLRKACGYAKLAKAQAESFQPESTR